MSFFDFTAMQETLQEIEDTPGGASSSDIMPSSCAEETVPRDESRYGECAVCLTADANTYFTCGHPVCSHCYETIMESGTSYRQSKCPLCRRVQFQAAPPRSMGYTAPPPTAEMLALVQSIPTPEEMAGLLALVTNYPAREVPERPPRVSREYIFINIEHGVNDNFAVSGLTDRLDPQCTVKAFKCVLARRLGLSYGIFIRDYDVVLISNEFSLANNRIHLDNQSLQIRGLRLYAAPGSACTVRIQRKP